MMASGNKNRIREVLSFVNSLCLGIEKNTGRKYITMDFFRLVGLKVILYFLNENTFYR